MSEDFKVPPEHLIFLASLLQEQSNENHWKELTKAFQKYSTARAWFLEVSEENSTTEKTIDFTQKERTALAILYREKAEKIIKEEKEIYWPTIRSQNLTNLAVLYISQKRYEDASAVLRRAILYDETGEAAEMLTTIPNFETDVKSIRAAISGLSQAETTAEQKLKAIKLATKHSDNPLIKADLAKIFYSVDPGEKNETTYKLLNESGYTDHLELAVFMAQKYMSDGDDKKAFYWWSVAIREGLEEMTEPLSRFIRHLTNIYPDYNQIFPLPYFNSNTETVDSSYEVENFYLAVIAADESPDSNIAKASNDFILNLANNRKSSGKRSPTLHLWASSFYADVSHASKIEEQCLFVDQLEPTDDYISKDYEVIENGNSPEEYFEEVINNKIKEMRGDLLKHYEECGQWWKNILSSRHPDRFKPLFSFVQPYTYMKVIPKEELAEIYSLVNNIPRAKVPFLG